MTKQFPRALIVDPTNPQIVYAGFGVFTSGIHKSSDGGATWSAINNGLPSSAGVYDLVIDRNNPAIVYAACGGFGVYKSTDGGASWGVFNDGLVGQSVNVLAIDTSGRYIHAGTGGGGVFDYPAVAGCSYSISSSSQPFPSSGGNGSISITATAGCAWTATSNDNWITVTSGNNGSGNGTINFSVATNNGSSSRTGTVSIAGQTLTVIQASSPPPTTPPVLITEENSSKAAALDSVTMMRDPFSLFTMHNFSSDRRTRVMLFATNLELLPGENISVVTAQAEDSQQRIFPLTVEYVGKVSSFNWLTQVVVRLPDGLTNAGDVRVSISLRGITSNKALLSIRPSQ